MADTYRARLDLHYHDFPDGCALYDPETDSVHVLNLTAALVWSSCDGHHDAEAIARLLGEATGAPAESLRVDVGEALADLERRKLVLTTAAPP